MNVVQFETGKHMLGTTADMADILHPNAQGHTEIAHALLDGVPGTGA